MPDTVIPTITDAQFAQRIADLFPRGWASDDAKQTGRLHDLLLTFGQELAVVLGQIRYAADASRIQTATYPELDEASLDLLGDRLPRPDGMSDADFAALITASLFQPAATRAALAAAIKRLTGADPRMMEPWNVLDTGWWNGKSYWNIDTTKNPARWGNGSLRYQGFIETIPPTITPLGPSNPVLGWGKAYWNVPGYFFGIISTAPQDDIYDIVTRLKAEGTLVWVKVLASAKAGETTIRPSAPLNVRGSDATSSSIAISWDPPATGTPPFQYTIIYRLQGSAGTYTVGPSTSGNSAVLSGLQPGLIYEIKVMVRNDAGSETSDSLIYQTGKIPPGPALNLHATAIGPSAVTLAWDPPASGTRPFQYQVRFRKTGDTDWIPFGIPGDYLTTTVTGLEPNTSYDFEVVTSNL